MNPHEVWCPNLECPARGQAGQGNIGVHSQKEQRYRCHVCHKTFAQRAPARTGTLWLSMAMMVSTRMWLGGVIRTRRDQALITRLVSLVAACELVAPLLLVVDGFSSYIDAFRRAFRTREHQGGPGAPRKVPWREMVIGPLVKEYVGKRVVGVRRRLVQGTSATARRLMAKTPGCVVLNTAYIERLNGTLRARLAPLARRTHHLVHRKEVLHAGMYLVGALYNFCTVHGSLRLASGQQQTPAMAAGLTDHCWSVGELLWHRVPPPRWQPPKQRGRRSKAMRELIERCSPPTVMLTRPKRAPKGLDVAREAVHHQQQGRDEGAGHNQGHQAADQGVIAARADHPAQPEAR